MSFKVKLSWKVLVSSPDKKTDYYSDSNLFSVRTSKGILSRIGGISSLSFVPYTLEPTNVFYNSIEPVKRVNNFTGKKLPYNFKSSLSQISSSRINISIRRYSNSTIILSVSLDSFKIADNISELHSLQKLETHLEAYCLVKAICALFSSGGSTNHPENNSLKYYPVASIKNLSSSTISDIEMVELLTRHKKPKDEIVRNVIEKNLDHQLDTNNILIDRQGVTANYAPDNGEISTFQRKVSSVESSFELAIATASVLENYSYFKLSDHEKLSITNLIAKPESIFTKSVTAYKTWVLLLDEFKLKTLYETVMESNQSDFNEIEEQAPKAGWSEGKKWSMGILSAVILMLIAWGITELKSTTPDNLVILNPDDEQIITNSREIDFSWGDFPGSNKYIIFIEKLNPEDNAWKTLPNGGRYVTQETERTLRIDSYGRFRWKVIARDDDEEKLAESKWFFFQLQKYETPNKSSKRDAVTGAPS
jgi:hypothetical protein